jgi:hypothetical protein
VGAQGVHDEASEGDGPVAACAFRRGENRLVLVAVGELSIHAKGAAQEVDTIHAQAACLALTEPRADPEWDCDVQPVGERLVDLLDDLERHGLRLDTGGPWQASTHGRTAGIMRDAREFLAALQRTQFDELVQSLERDRPRKRSRERELEIYRARAFALRLHGERR